MDLLEGALHQAFLINTGKPKGYKHAKEKTILMQG